nr:GC rich sequence DNA binding factor 1 [Hymenolepis microstoma]
MFRKPRRALRVHRKDDLDKDSDEEQSESSKQIEQAPPVIAKPVTSKATLSFGDDLDEMDTFKVKRPAHSRKIVKQLKEGKSSLKSPSSDSNALKSSIPERTQSYPVTLEDSSGSSDPPAEEEIIKVKPLTRASSEQFSSMLKQGVIPDASTIHMVRKHRQQAKFQLQAEEESNSPPHVSGNDGQRLIREEDDDAEEDDGSDFSTAEAYQHRRPAFTLTAEYRDPSSRRRIDISRGLQRRRDLEMRKGLSEVKLQERRTLVDAAERESAAVRGSSGDESEDEDAVTWERQQIQKAVSSKNTAVLEALEPTTSTNEGGLLPTPSRRSSDFGNVTLTSLKTMLQERLDKKNTILRKNKAELLAAREDLKRGEVTMSSARSKLPQLAETLKFYMEIREYVRDLISCFNEKMPKIEYLDKRAYIIYRERTDTLMARRRADVGDLADEVTGLTGTDSTVDPKTLEARKRRKVDREARCARRRKMKQDEAYKKRIEAEIGVFPPCEGVSSDDEEQQYVIKKRSDDFDDIKKDAGYLFDDVVEEYCTISSILQRFDEWRNRVVSSYAQAYIPMCLPLLLAPLVRVQMLSWNPLEANCPFFDQYGWFMDFLDYFADLKRVEDLENDASEDAQRKVLFDLATSSEHELTVIPHVIETVLLPRLTEIVSASWDPLSWSQTQRLVNVVQSFATLWPTVSADSKATQRLFEAVLQRMEATIQGDIFIPLYPKQLMLDSQTPARQFFDRQMNVSMKLLSSLLKWHNLLAPAALKHLVFTCLVNRYILIGLASVMATASDDISASLPVWESVTNRLKAIVFNLPLEWLSDPEDMQLTQLRRFTSQLIDRLKPYEVSSTSTETKEQMEFRPVLKKLRRIYDRLLAKSSST